MTSVMRLLADRMSEENEIVPGPHKVEVTHLIDGMTWHSVGRFHDIEGARSVADEVRAMEGVQSVEVIEGRVG